MTSNPFNDYRLNKGLTWLKLAKMCDLSEGQIAYLLKMDADRLGGLNLLTAAKIKDGIGVDLFKYVLEHYKSSSKTAVEQVDESVTSE